MVNVSVARWPMERGQFGSEVVVAGCESLIITHNKELTCFNKQMNKSKLDI